MLVKLKMTRKQRREYTYTDKLCDLCVFSTRAQISAHIDNRVDSFWGRAVDAIWEELFWKIRNTLLEGYGLEE